MKPKYKRLILWLILVLHISLIFSFSLQTAEKSSVLSDGLTGLIKSHEQFEKEVADEKNPDGSAKYGADQTETVAESRFGRIENFIRKTAHFFLFFLLGIIINLLLACYGIVGIFGTVTTIPFAATIAFLDETVQLFSAGRAGMLSDVFLDVLGAAAGSILFFIGGLVYEKIKNRRTEMDN